MPKMRGRAGSGDTSSGVTMRQGYVPARCPNPVGGSRRRPRDACRARAKGPAPEARSWSRRSVLLAAVGPGERGARRRDAEEVAKGLPLRRRDEVELEELVPAPEVLARRIDVPVPVLAPTRFVHVEKRPVVGPGGLPSPV